jgi:hypothetical protein
VRQALSTLRHDPNLSRGEKTRELTWVRRSSGAEGPTFELPHWLLQALKALGAGGRVLLWIAAGLAAAVLIVYLLRLARQHAADGRLAALPTHVLELDIRPESLPADVGAAALALWERGEQRAALALLYRGLLSRLVHVHSTPIRASSTEDDCAQAAALRLAGAPLAYVREVIGVWQAAVYGGTAPAPARFRGLCAGLDAALPPAAPDGTS